MKNSNTQQTWRETASALPVHMRERFIQTASAFCTNESKGRVSDPDTYFTNCLHQGENHPVIYIGMGTCGLAAGAGDTAQEVASYIAERGSTAELVHVGCIGLCCAEPILDIKLPGKNRISFRNITADKARPLLDSLLGMYSDESDLPADTILAQVDGTGKTPWKGVPAFTEHPFFAPQKRIVLDNCGIISPVSISDYIARGGYACFLNAIHSHTSQEICDIIKKSGLRGRGGGGFPTGTKWQIALDAVSPRKFIICNADEGDPGAFMDRAVCEGDPHSLLEGLAIGGYAIGARKAYIYIRAEYPLAIERLKKAISDMQEFQLLGENIWDSGFSLDIAIKEGAGAFVCGEETALIHSIEGKRGMPRPRPPYPSVKGLHGKPTVINNVETLANIPRILTWGAEWFSSLGTENSKGTKVFALSGKIKNTGLVEVIMGSSIRDILFTIGGGIPDNKKFKAVQIGGPSGGCIPEQHLDIKIDYDSLKEVGAMMGSGGLVVMDEDNCMVDVAKFFMDFIQRESCGKCIPCREGTKKILSILKSITRPRRSEGTYETLSRFKDVLKLESLAQVIKETSLCGLGQSAPNPVLSTIRWFRHEYEAHIFERKCPSKTCVDLLTYTIDPDFCKGCMVCLNKCPVQAIMGQKKTPHYIVPDKCIGCGTCIDVCRFNAISCQ